MAIRAVMKSMQAKRIVSTKPERSMQVKKEGRMAFVKKQQLKKEGAIQAVTKKTPAHIAKGRLKYFLVYSGRRQKTSGGLTKECIGINKRGRYVSLKMAENGAKIYDNIKPWNTAFTSARRQLNCAGFVAINGRTLMGQALYIRMKKLHVQNAEATDQKKEETKAEQIPEKMEVAPDMADPVASITPAAPTTVPDSDVEPAVSE